MFEFVRVQHFRDCPGFVSSWPEDGLRELNELFSGVPDFGLLERSARVGRPRKVCGQSISALFCGFEFGTWIVHVLSAFFTVGTCFGTVLFVPNQLSKANNFFELGRGQSQLCLAKTASGLPDHARRLAMHDRARKAFGPARRDHFEKDAWHGPHLQDPWTPAAPNALFDRLMLLEAINNSEI